MTLPELCECGENQDTTMPDSSQTDKVPSTPTPTTTTTSTIPIPPSPTPPSSPTTTTTPTSAVDKLGKALLGVLQQAACQGRATCSLPGCVELLSQRPDDVMLCVMPPLLPQADAAATIQSTLIRAVCTEHSIRVITVDCDVKLAKAVCGIEEEEEKVKAEKTSWKWSGIDDDGDDDDARSSLDENFNHVLKMKTPSPCTEDAPLLISDCDNLAPVMGFPCVLVEFPQDASPEDEVVAQFGKEQLYGQQLTEPYIELPD